MTTTVRTSGRLIGCATLLVTRALLKLPVEELLLVPGLFSSGSGLGTTLAEAQRARRGLANLRNALDQTFARTGIGCPKVIRALPYETRSSSESGRPAAVTFALLPPRARSAERARVREGHRRGTGDDEWALQRGADVAGQEAAASRVRGAGVREVSSPARARRAPAR